MSEKEMFLEEIYEGDVMFEILKDKADEEIAIEMFLDWAFGRDDRIRQSDIFCWCDECDLDYDEIVKLAQEKAKSDPYLQ